GGTTYLIQSNNYFNVGDALSALDLMVTQVDGRVSALETAPAVAPGAPANPRVAVGGTGAGDDPAVVGEGTGVAIGSSATANTSTSVAVGEGAYAHGPNDTALGAEARVGADGSTAVGAHATITAAATNAVAVGEGATVSAASGTAIGEAASVTAEGAVAMGQGSVADRANTVSVGAAGAERAITNVAMGTASTDAVNVAQMDAASTNTLSRSKTYTDTMVGALSDRFDDYRGQVETRFAEQDRRMDRQGAMSAAMMNMATSAAGINTPNRVAAGVGFQGGETALSVGYQRAIGERATFSLGGAFSGDDKSIGMGAGFGW
ncbi:MAG: YadA family autotransporter adhesin, partial [Stenotrophomonas sp.]